MQRLLFFLLVSMKLASMSVDQIRREINCNLGSYASCVSSCGQPYLIKAFESFKAIVNLLLFQGRFDEAKVFLDDMDRYSSDLAECQLEEFLQLSNRMLKGVKK
jgi:hypothetical protein